jgi:hypothetical protein
MKTPLQEFIEIIKKRQEDDEALPFMYNAQIIKLAESLLEKEKEVMCYFAKKWDMELGDAKIRSAESCFNETFNTKEE